MSSPTNYFSPAKWVVSHTAGEGNFNNIGRASANASAGDTIVIMPGVYEQDQTLKPGVNYTAFGSDSSVTGLGNVIIRGNCNLSSAGTVNMYGIELQTNSDFCISVTGSADCILNLNNCYVNNLNNTGIQYTNSSLNSGIFFQNCLGDLGTTGIALYSATSPGGMNFRYSSFSNSGGSTTPSNNSDGSVNWYWSNVSIPISTSSTAPIGIFSTMFDTSAINTTSLTLNGSGQIIIDESRFISGTASAISIGSGAAASLVQCNIASSNTNAITGSGTLNDAATVFSGSSSGVNVSTRNTIPWPAQQGGTGLTSPGTMGNVLTSTGSAWTSSAPAAGGITTVGNVTSGSVAFDGTAGTILTGTTAGLTLTAASGTSTGALVQLVGGVTTGTNQVGGSVSIAGTSGTGTGAGGEVELVAGLAGATGNGGPVMIESGTGGSTSGNGGLFTLQAGPADTAGTGGNMIIASGIGGSTSGASGTLTLKTGDNSGAANAGANILIKTGTASGTNQVAGNIAITAGQSTGNGAPGNFTVNCDPIGAPSGTSTNVPIPRIFSNGFINPLTSTSPVAVLQASLPSGSTAGGMLNYTIEVTNGTDYQCGTGIVAYSMVNKGGTITGTAGNIGAEVQNVTGLTSLINAWSVDSSGNLNLTSTTNLLTVTVYRLTYTAFSNSQHTVTYN